VIGEQLEQGRALDPQHAGILDGGDGGMEPRSGQRFVNPNQVAGRRRTLLALFFDAQRSG